MLVSHLVDITLIYIMTNAHKYGLQVRSGKDSARFTFGTYINVMCFYFIQYTQYNKHWFWVCFPFNIKS